MTKEEVCKKFNISESMIDKHFSRAQEKILKEYSVQLTKKGRGASAVYEISDYQTLEVAHSIKFIQDAHKEVIMDRTIFSELVDWNFMIFIGIITCPFITFRGSYKDFLTYVGVKNITADCINKLKKSLEEMSECGLIMYSIDPTNTDYFWAGVYRKVETEMKIGIDMIQRCIRLQEENNMKSWVPILKTWIGLQIIVLNEKKETFTLAELEKITGVNQKMLTKCKKILEKDNLFITSRAYSVDFICKGSNINLNGLEYDYKCNKSV